MFGIGVDTDFLCDCITIAQVTIATHRRGTLVQRNQLCKCISIQNQLITSKQGCYTNHNTL